MKRTLFFLIICLLATPIWAQMPKKSTPPKPALKKANPVVKQSAVVGKSGQYSSIQKKVNLCIPFEVNNKVYALLDFVNSKGLSFYRIDKDKPTLLRVLYEYPKNPKEHLSLHEVEFIGTSDNYAYVSVRVNSSKDMGDTWSDVTKFEIWKLGSEGSSVVYANTTSDQENSRKRRNNQEEDNTLYRFYIDRSGRLLGLSDKSAFYIDNMQAIKIKEPVTEGNTSTFHFFDGNLYCERSYVYSVPILRSPGKNEHKSNLFKIENNTYKPIAESEYSSDLKVIGKDLVYESKIFTDYNKVTLKRQKIDTLSNWYFDNPNNYLKKQVKEEEIITKQGNFYLKEDSEKGLIDLWNKTILKDEALSENGFDSQLGKESSNPDLFLRVYATVKDKTYIRINVPYEETKWVTTNGTKEGTQVRNFNNEEDFGELFGAKDHLITANHYAKYLKITDINTGKIRKIAFPRELNFLDNKIFISSQQEAYLAVSDGLSTYDFIYLNLKDK